MKPTERDVRPFEYHYQFWCRHLVAQWAATAVRLLPPTPEPVPEPVPGRAPEPKPTPEPPQQEPVPDPPRASAKSIKGWDWMRAQHKQLQRAHLQRR
jgi:hypothetical protein